MSHLKASPQTSCCIIKEVLAWHGQDGMTAPLTCFPAICKARVNHDTQRAKSEHSRHKLTASSNTRHHLGTQNKKANCKNISTKYKKKKKSPLPYLIIRSHSRFKSSTVQYQNLPGTAFKVPDCFNLVTQFKSSATKTFTQSQQQYPTPYSNHSRVPHGRTHAHWSCRVDLVRCVLQVPHNFVENQL